MPVDFTKFQVISDRAPIHPRDVFSALSGRAEGFGYLRDVQGQVLDAWFHRRTDRDVVIKMNTGTGKTAVGLLALRSSLNEGIAPALYVAPDNFLAGQAAAQAKSLGIEYVGNPDSSEYLSGKSIGIVNIQKLVNGRSVFGGPGNTRVNPLEIGMVVVDDAHACVRTVEQQTTVSIPRVHPAYEEMLKLFETDLRAQSYSTFIELQSNAIGAILRVPVSAWSERQSNVIELLQSLHMDEANSSLMFSWPFLKDILPACQAIFSSESFEIHPLCPPTNSIVSLERADRRLYLTATLPDDSVLVTHFGVSAQSAVKPISPSSAADIGDRLILSVRELDGRIADETVREIVASLAKKYNVVVLVPSYRRARVWSDKTEHIVGADEIEAVVESLKEDHVGLVVFVNKYDGVDLPGQACRVLVIDGVPEAMNNAERREGELLGGSDVLAHRTLQRIEQGMGRGVRSTDDYCVVLLLGAGLSAVLAKPRIYERLGPATRAQLDLSMAVAREIGIDDLVSVLEQCLNRDSSWLQVSRECLSGIAYGEGSVEPFAAKLRSAFVAATLGQFDAACEEVQEALNRIQDDTTKGWLKECLATYLQNINPVQAQSTLEGAVKLNSRVMRPLSGVSYKRAETKINQAVTASQAFKEDFGSGTELRLSFEDLVSRLSFDPKGAKDFENAVEELGRLLGFESQRPERDTGRGPDALWGVGDMSYFVIECKSAAESEVWKHDAAQLGHSMNWFAEEYDSTSVATPLLIHHSGELAHDAALPQGTRLIDRSRLRNLQDALVEYATVLSNRHMWDDADAIRSLLVHREFTAQGFLQRYTKKVN
ncbi:MAG: DEAD/DEAH box helicase [Acidimicrobiaceae bacterium]|nr:DEAD/DEAH box helicase [Acidimicrobiaceae bacterium]